MVVDVAGRYIRATSMRRLTVTLTTAASVLLLASACGSSGSSSTGSSGTGSSGGKSTSSLGSLSITIAGASTGNAPLYVAEVNGYFKDRGLTVNVTNAGSAAFTEAAAGKVDMSMTGTTAGLAPIVQGRQTVMIYSWGVGPDVAGVVVAANSPIQSLTGLAGKTVSSEGTSGSSFGTAQALSNYVKQKTGKGFQLVSDATLPAQADEVISGRVTAAVGLASIWAPYILAGKLKLLVNPATSTEVQTIFGSSLVNLSIWGLPSLLAQKKAAVTAFMGGLLEANKFIDSHTDAQVAAVMVKSPLLTGDNVKQLTYGFSLDRPFVDKTQGQITQSGWNSSLKTFAGWGLGLDPSNPNLAYSKAVDMSYLDAASANG
jgi:NitT/TauT family transport system substrate-binding protein